MNHYQKLGTLLFRIIGLLCSAIGVLGLAYAAFSYAALGTLVEGYDRWPASCFYAILGLVIYRLSEKIGKFFGKGLD